MRSTRINDLETRLRALEVALQYDPYQEAPLRDLLQIAEQIASAATGYDGELVGAAKHALSLHEKKT